MSAHLERNCAQPLEGCVFEDRHPSPIGADQSRVAAELNFARTRRCDQSFAQWRAGRTHEEEKQRARGLVSGGCALSRPAAHDGPSGGRADTPYPDARASPDLQIENREVFRVSSSITQQNRHDFNPKLPDPTHRSLDHTRSAHRSATAAGRRPETRPPDMPIVRGCASPKWVNSSKISKQLVPRPSSCDEKGSILQDRAFLGSAGLAVPNSEDRYFRPPRLSRNTPCSPNRFHTHQGILTRSGRP